MKITLTSAQEQKAECIVSQKGSKHTIQSARKLVLRREKRMANREPLQVTGGVLTGTQVFAF
jgi:hypothetical protein